MDQNLLFSSAIEIAASIRSGSISAAEMLELQFSHVDAVNPIINGIIWQDREGARAQAKRLDEEAAQGRFRGPLHGVPITVKEAFDLVGSPSTWGYPEWQDNFPSRDSQVVERYRRAGANVFGKTNVPKALYEWQSFNAIYGTTNNPWDLERTPGGSSGGSAAALASGMTALEAGSDIGSSIRNPAHYCGVFGLKPSWGVVPLQGHLPRDWLAEIDIAVTGPMARSAGDLSLAFEILGGADCFLHPAWSVDCPDDERDRISQFKIAVKLGDSESPVDQPYLDVLATFATQLSEAGAQVSLEAQPAVDSAAHFDNYLTLLGAALSAGSSDADTEALRESVRALADPAIERVTAPRIAGMELRHRDWLAEDNRRRQSRTRFDAFFEDWDLLIVPVCASAAFPHDHAGERHTRYIPVNGKPQPEMLQLFWSGYSGVVGLPSVVGPAGFVGKLPVGYQAIAGFGRDRTALAFARAVECELEGFVPPRDPR